MILYGGPTSPFARLSIVVARELDLDLEVKIINVYEAEFLDDINPLRQIPTLLTNENEPIYDSRNICRYFDELASKDKPTIWPDRDFVMATNFSLVLGIMEAGLQRYMESIKADAEVSKGTLEKLGNRILCAISHADQKLDLNSDDVTIDKLAYACALEYTDFRFSSSWRDDNPRSKDWLKEFNKRDSLAQTRLQ